MNPPSAKRVPDGPRGSKSALRRFVRTLSVAPRAEDDARAAHNLESLQEWSRARSVALYAALPGEVRVEGVHGRLDERGVRVALPRLAGNEIVLHPARSGDPLHPGRGGILEPDAASPTVAPGTIDLFVVPGLLFDGACRWLGRGGGHYDRLLAAARADAVRVGLCYADRMIDRVPTDPWDQSMDVVVTDRDVCRAKGARRESR